MFYFKTISFDDFQHEAIENALRKTSAKRHTPLDFHSSAAYLKDDKRFIGYENKKSIQITRIRTPFERFLPKLILSFEKEVESPRLKIRYSILPAIFFCVLTVAFLINIYYSVTQGNINNNIYRLIIWLLIFLGLTFIELQITLKQVKQVIK